MKRYFILLFAFLFAGCGEFVKVGGKVVYQDGTPVKAGIVYFENDTNAYRGTVQEDGSFRLGRYKDGDGIPKGKYDAYITGSYDEEFSETTGAIIKRTFYLDQKYQDKHKSGLSFEITKTIKDLAIIVDKPTTPVFENKQPQDKKINIPLP
ncbi:MAG: hypothetical protein LBJ00_01180 [Planctomycetaceae bacterium]|jgi:hypothetical protein|nr:hypothetical protein [Planctomycetaceae bacterium]